MDLQTALICFVLVVLSGAVLLSISMFGMQEKTYEEAIAEQRKMPNGALILGRPSKDKNKYKKQKRQGKKVQQKSSNSKKMSEKKNSKKQSESSFKFIHKEIENGHVNFLNHDVGALNEVKSITQSGTKKKKNEKMKPILLNKKESAVLNKQNQKNAVNHFTEIIPKDELQLKLSSGKINHNLPITNKNQVNTNENNIDVEPKFKEKVLSKVVLREINNKVESEKNEKNEVIKVNQSSKINRNDKTKTEKIKNEKINEQIKNEKMKEEKPTDENGLKNDKVKEENKVKSEKKKEDKTKSEKEESKLKDENKKKNEKSKDEKNKKDKLKIEEKIQPKQNPQKQVKANEVNENIPPEIMQMKKILIHHQQADAKILKNTNNKTNKKNDLYFLQQMSERDGINVNLLIPLIRKAELSRTEVQVLTDILLTKHLDEVSDQFEWIEGRQDPVVKLKKQLAEKEKALAEEQEASQAFQNKLKELRSEYNSERARLTQACRQYDETILAKQSEIQNLHATNRHLMDSHVAEKQALTQKIQQLQAQVNDESLVIRKLQEDHNQTQTALQQELVNQSQQMEIHIGRLGEQLQDAQKNFEAQIHNKMQEAEQMRASLNAELQKNRRHEEELRELREQQVQNQSKIKSLESRASQLKESNSYTQELMRQIEELQRVNKELEIRCNNSQQMEEEFKFEKSKLQGELHNFTNKVSDLQNECDKLLKERDKLKSQISAKIDLEKDVLRLKEENQCLINQASSLAKIEKEAQQLREENENLAAQVTAFIERSAADGRENGDSSYNEEKSQTKPNTNDDFIKHETDAPNDIILGEIKQKQLLFDKLKSELIGCQTEIAKLSSEVSKYKTEIPKLTSELEAQRHKNNDLRKKNWKAMEALSLSEKSLENNLRESEKSIQVRVEEERQMSKDLLERLFPNIKVDEKVYINWVSKFEKNAKNYLDELQASKENSNPESLHFDSEYVEELESRANQASAQVVHYKKIIEDTEGMLNKLQNHVEQEEIRWRQTVESLEPQIQSLKDKLTVAEDTNEKLESKVKELEGKNTGDVNSIRNECNELRRLAEIESEKFKELSQQIEAVKSKLATEEEKNKELNKEVAYLRSTIKFGQDAYLEENKKRLELEDEIKLLKSESIKGTAINSSGDFVAFEKDGLENQ